ncbi:MAG: hypothetical protein P4L48_18245 [Mycobacterium sp.]|nr:hypothetical protein [Mycobacterium sp.]
MTDVEMPNIPLPPLAVSSGDWDLYDNPPTRVVVGRYREFHGANINVRVAAIQDIHGRIDLVDPPQILLDNQSFDAPQIRAFAAVLVEAADELDQWNARVHAAHSGCRSSAITHPCVSDLQQSDEPRS